MKPIRPRDVAIFVACWLIAVAAAFGVLAVVVAAFIP